MKSLNSYLKNAWGDLSSDEGWWRVILVLGLLNCVPLVGPVFVCGYLYDWAKEAAWGMRSGMSHAVGDIARRGKYGVMAIAVVLIWVAPILIVAQLLRLVPVVGQVLCFLVELLAVLVTVLASAAALRSIIYERMAPGLQVSRVFKMARKDTSGLFQAFAIGLLYVVLLVAVLFILLLPAVPFVGVIMSSSPEAILGASLPFIVMLGMLTIVVAVIVWVASSVCATLIFALYARALGYWIEQFEPAKWRSPTEPMPFEIEQAEKKKAKAEEKARAKAAAKEAKKQKKAGASDNEGETSEAAPEASDDAEQAGAGEHVDADVHADAGEMDVTEQDVSEQEANPVAAQEESAEESSAAVTQPLETQNEE